jgi:hypothetical protein
MTSQEPITLNNDQIEENVIKLIKHHEFKDIDQEQNLCDLLAELHNGYFPENSPTHKNLENRRKHLEESVMCLITSPSDQSRARENFEAIEDCFSDSEIESNDTCFYQGVAEGFRLCINILRPVLIIN